MNTIQTILSSLVLVVASLLITDAVQFGSLTLNKFKPRSEYTIKGKVWKIKLVKKVDEFDSMGEADCTNRIIKIKKSLSDKDMRVTLTHEIGHAVSKELGLENMTNFNPDYEELICDGIATTLEELFDLKNKKAE